LVEEVAKVALCSHTTILEVEIGVHICLAPLAPKGPFLTIVDEWQLTLSLAILVFILCCLSEWLD
jgi:low affinity Fe/Cu permease